jgi:hypothetical protein
MISTTRAKRASSGLAPADLVSEAGFLRAVFFRTAPLLARGAAGVLPDAGRRWLMLG